jgi:cytochrome c oxidase assembly factor CtaG
VIDLPFGFTGWKPDLLIAVPLAVSGGLYLLGLMRLSRRQTRGLGSKRWEAAAFVTGWMTLVAALLSPIATVAEALLSVHMTQHELLMLVAAPLLALGRPLVPMLWALPARWRARVKGTNGFSPALRYITSPAAVFALHAVALWVWHLPVLYQAAVLDDRIHAVQHVSFTATAALFWWGTLRGRYGRLGYGAAVLYVFATALHSGGLGALMTLSSTPWYPLYVERAHNHGAALVDQQLAGLLMWIPAGIVLTLFALAIFAAWLGEAERRRRLTAAATRESSSWPTPV